MKPQRGEMIAMMIHRADLFRSFRDSTSMTDKFRTRSSSDGVRGSQDFNVEGSTKFFIDTRLFRLNPVATPQSDMRGGMD